MKYAHEFFAMQRERYRILLRRRGLLPRLADGNSPNVWTRDPVLAAWRFCNVFREDDRTTVWFRENIREPLRNDPKVLLATVAFRWFNRIETGEKIKDILLEGNWDSREVRRRLYLTQPVVTGAYMIKTPPGLDKLDGVCWCIDEFVKGADHLLARLPSEPVLLESFWRALRTFPYMGGFMAYEVVSDLRHTHILERAQDINSWANAGPGCTRGVGRVVSGNPDQYNSTSEADQREMLSVMREILDWSRHDDNWPKEWPKWEMREVEHGLCEFDKYKRGQAGEKLKRRYP